MYLPKPKKSKKFFWVRGIVIVLVIALVSGAVYAYILVKRITKPNVKAKSVEINQPVNILLLGLDAGDANNKSSDNPRRSDTMMLVRYVPQDNKVYILSIPRDTKVRINNKTMKINAANAIGGPSLAVKTVENLLGVDINYYVKIDYSGFKKVIDAVGGVDIVIPQNMDYDASDIHIHFKKGQNVHLDGNKAEAYVRWRKNNNGGGYALGDIGRVSAQQDFIVKVFEKVKSPSGIVRLPSLLSTVTKYVETNMEAQKIAQYFVKIHNIESDNIKKEVLAGEGKYIGKVSYYICDVSKSEDFISNFKNDGIAASENEVDRKSIKITVSNGAGVDGLAAKYQKELEDQGYNVVNINNYSRRVNKTMIYDYGNKNYGKAVKKSLGFGEVEVKNDSGSKSNIVVVLGEDSVK